MAKAVMQPLTPAEGMRRTLGDGRPMAAEASEFIKPNSRLTSFSGWRFTTGNTGSGYWIRWRKIFLGCARWLDKSNLTG